ncbi:MAG: SDR family oxidoreductase [Lactobacillus sp.]|jgi:3-oxoacyl-[acyl-carrier protein] reductase|nr:SDR family oxidoreductase [Lactobacillus sp.]
MKRVLITGASDGLGRELARLCIGEGIEVVCISRSQPDYSCEYIKTDLAVEESIKKCADEIKDKYAKFDALVNCAGVISIGSPEEIDYKELDNLMKVNSMAPIFLTSQLLKLIKENEADIINVGSTAGTKGKSAECIYGASKWALQGVSKSLQDDLAKTKCRVTMFNPGGMQTKLFDKHEEGKVSTAAFMSPRDVAELMLYILKLPKKMEISEILVNKK